MTIESIFGAIIIGLILGVVGRALAPGKQDIPIWLTIVVGMAAALIGTLIVGPLRDTSGWFDWTELVAQIVLAVVGVIIAAGMYGNRKSKT
ncbi:MAG TPA: GlsB/YeaQ/YmgE family stress response membrane protein [Nocardioidaceae bacterium]|nr:GlsB/YeaQ/YmgE family stress response membrane protein [Nocardioidaceae bacterium]